MSKPPLRDPYAWGLNASLPSECLEPPVAAKPKRVRDRTRVSTEPLEVTVSTVAKEEP